MPKDPPPLMEGEFRTSRSCTKVEVAEVKKEEEEEDDAFDIRKNFICKFIKCYSIITVAPPEHQQSLTKDKKQGDSAKPPKQ